MRTRRFVSGEEFAIFEIYYSTIHFIARNDYSEEQLNAWAPLNLDREMWGKQLNITGLPLTSAKLHSRSSSDSDLS